MTLIPDPTDERAPAIVSDEKGTRLAPTVMFAPVGTPHDHLTAWKVAGWITAQNAFELGDPPTST